MGGRRLAQSVVAEERQITVGGIVVDRSPRRLERRPRRPKIGIEIFEAQERGIAGRIGFGADPVDADLGHVTQPADRHRAVRNSSTSRTIKAA